MIFQNEYENYEFLDTEMEFEENTDINFNNNKILNNNHTSFGSEVRSSEHIAQTSSPSQNEKLIEKLLKDISELQNEVKSSNKREHAWQRKYKSSQNKLKTLRHSLSKYFNSDQMDGMCSKKVKWLNATVKKGLILKYKLGSKFYDTTFRKKYAPYPSACTLNSRIKELKMKPGILKFNIKILGMSNYYFFFYYSNAQGVLDIKN